MKYKSFFKKPQQILTHQIVVLEKLGKEKKGKKKTLNVVLEGAQHTGTGCFNRS